MAAPVSVPAKTQTGSGSGAQAIVTVAQQIATGEVDAAIGGMENMDRAPYLMDGGAATAWVPPNH